MTRPPLCPARPPVPLHWLAVALLAAAASLAPSALGAQQFATDDAGLAAFPACQVEAWRGETETRIEPACRLVRDLEVMLGLGFDPSNPDRLEEYALELKTGLRAPEPGGLGLAVVAGLEFDARPDEEHGRLASVFAYLPATLSVGDDRLLLHANLGWRFARPDDAQEEGDAERAHALTWGLRGDLEVPGLDERFVTVGELFGEDRGRPQFQVGVRTRVVPDRLLVDVSWGGHLAPGERGRGWVFGFAWTPPSLQ